MTDHDARNKAMGEQLERELVELDATERAMWVDFFLSLSEETKDRIYSPKESDPGR